MNINKSTTSKNKFTAGLILSLTFLPVLSFAANIVNTKPPLSNKEMYQMAGYFSSIAYNDEESQKYKEKLLKEKWIIKCDAFHKTAEEILTEIEEMSPEEFKKSLDKHGEYSLKINDSNLLLDKFIDKKKGNIGNLYIQSLHEKFDENYSANKSNIERIGQHFGYAIGKKKFDDGRKVYVIAFRGTSDTYSWIFTDFLAFPTKFLNTETHVHAGFEWNRQACVEREILSNFIKEISQDKNDPTLILTGHSLGAALAVLENAAFIEDKLLKPEKIHLITLAEPCPGKEDFINRYKSKDKIKNYRWFCNLFDPVPIAPMIVGYKHFDYPRIKVFNIGPKVPPIKNTFERHSLKYYLQYLKCDA